MVDARFMSHATYEELVCSLSSLVLPFDLEIRTYALPHSLVFFELVCCNYSVYLFVRQHLDRVIGSEFSNG